MTDPLLTTIVYWGPNWAPRGWTQCNGQLLAISQFTAVFSLIGTIYGGDGRTTFRLPDLRGRVPISYGQSPGTGFYAIGAMGGTEYVTLNTLEMPQHNHSLSLSSLTGVVGVYNGDGNTNVAMGHVPANGVTPPNPPIGAGTANVYSTNPPNATGQSVSISGTGTVGYTGGSQSHENRQPFQVMNSIFALQGIYPSRN